MPIHTLFTGVANTHLVTGPSGVIVIDAGMPHMARWILHRVRALGYDPRDVRLILLTHGHIDHAGSAVALRRLTGAPIALHRGDARLVATPDLKIPPARSPRIHAAVRVLERFGRWIPLETFTPDVWLDEAFPLADVGLKGRIVCTPGHTQGSVSVALDEGAVFVGDAILNLVRVSFPLVWEDPGAARETALRIQSLHPRLVYSGHGRTFGPSELDAFIEKVRRGNSWNH